MSSPESDTKLEGQSAPVLEACVLSGPQENDQIVPRDVGTGILRTVKKGKKIFFETVSAAEIPVGSDAEYDFRMKTARAASANTAGNSHFQLELGSAVAPIIRSQAYLKEELNLNEFCQENFGYGRTRVMEMVESYEMHLWLPLNTPIGLSLEAIRTLRYIKQENRAEAWALALKVRKHRFPRTNDIMRVGRREGFLIPHTQIPRKLEDAGLMPEVPPVLNAPEAQALGSPEEALAAIEELEGLVLANHDSGSKEAKLVRHLLHYHERLAANRGTTTSSMLRAMETGAGTVLEDDMASLEGDFASTEADLTVSSNLVAAFPALKETDGSPHEQGHGRHFRPQVEPEVTANVISLEPTGSAIAKAAPGVVCEATVHKDTVPPTSEPSAPGDEDGRNFRPQTPSVAAVADPTAKPMVAADDEPAVPLESELVQNDCSSGAAPLFPEITVTLDSVKCLLRSPSDVRDLCANGVNFDYLGFFADEGRSLLVYSHYDPVKLDQKAHELRAKVDKALAAMPKETRKRVTGMLATEVRSAEEKRMPCPA
jgi:hypothetical protein